MKVEICEINYIPGESCIQTGFRRGQYPRANTYYGAMGLIGSVTPEMLRLWLTPMGIGLHSELDQTSDGLLAVAT